MLNCMLASHWSKFATFSLLPSSFHDHNLLYFVAAGYTKKVIKHKLLKFSTLEINLVHPQPFQLLFLDEVSVDVYSVFQVVNVMWREEPTHGRIHIWSKWVWWWITYSSAGKSLMQLVTEELRCLCTVLLFVELECHFDISKVNSWKLHMYLWSYDDICEFDFLRSCVSVSCVLMWVRFIKCVLCACESGACLCTYTPTVMRELRTKRVSGDQGSGALLKMNRYT